MHMGNSLIQIYPSKWKARKLDRVSSNLLFSCSQKLSSSMHIQALGREPDIYTKIQDARKC